MNYKKLEGLCVNKHANATKLNVLVLNDEKCTNTINISST